jgi:archaellum biogenesis protein FlaJ (TadC family)
MSVAMSEKPNEPGLNEPGIVLTEEQKRRRRARSIAIAVSLGVLVLLVYVVTVVKLGPGVLIRPL